MLKISLIKDIYLRIKSDTHGYIYSINRIFEVISNTWYNNTYIIDTIKFILNNLILYI